MNKNMLNQILKDRKRKTRSLALILCLSMVVSLGTFAGFHKTASAKVYTREVLDCPYTYEGAEPVAHVHNDDCYEGETLVCTLPEREAHTHTDECFTEQRVLVCGLEENPGHQHSEECYDENGELICQIPEGEGAHAHTEECYTIERVLTCDKPELPVHVHDAGCFRTEEISVDEPEETVAPEQTVNTVPEMPVSDPNADVETASDWEHDFDGMELSGNWARDLVLVAATQQGRGESPNNFEAVLNDAGDAWVRHGYTRYGAWYGVPYAEEWSAMFVSFCLRYAGIPEENVPNNPTAAFMAESFSNGELFAGRDYVPAVGDLIFFDTVDDEITNIDHMGIVYHVDTENGTINTVEGSRADAVATFGYRMDDEQIVGYGILPQNPNYIYTAEENTNDEIDGLIVMTEEEKQEETTVTADVTAPAVPMPAQSWERTAGGIKVVVEAPEGAFPENTKIAVTPVNGNNLKDTVSDAVNGEILEVQAVDITFFDAEGREIEPAVPIRVVMTPYENNHTEDKANVVHIDLEQQTAEVIAQAEGTEADNSEVVFDAEAFTIYAIVYTVHFEYEVDGETYTSASMPGAEYTSLAEVIRGLGIVSEEEVETFVSKISTVASTNEDVAVVENTDAGLCVRVLRDGDAQIVITMQDGATFRVDVVADGETATGNETATVSTVGDLYLPAEAKVEAKVLTEEQSEGAIASVEAQEGTAGITAAAETAYQVFDISLENVDAEKYNGFAVEVKLPENVVGRDFRLYHIHDGEFSDITDSLTLNSVERGSGLQSVESFSFEVQNFSEFVLSYTVDFEYNGFTFSLIGNESILLSELFAALGIEESTENIAYVEFSDYALLSIESTGADYLLISRMPFQSEETLTVAMTSGVIYAITVTDAQEQDITGTLENVEVVGADIDSNGNLIVVDGQYYTVNLTFRENDMTQFVNDGTTMVYTLPAGISVGNTSGTFTMDFGSLGKLENNTFRVENNTVYVNWNTSNQQMMNILKAASEAHFGISLETMFHKNQEHIEWSKEIITNLDVTEPHDADVKKSGQYNPETDKIEYTVTVSSTGTTSGIKITDGITGTALRSDVNTVNDITVTVKHKDGTTATVTPTGFNKTENGFVLNLPDMEDGDVYTVNYTASVLYDELSRNGKTTYLETNNGVILEYNENPEPEYDNSFGYNINYSSINKSSTHVGDVIEDETGKYRIVDYKIIANTEKKTSVSKIYDSIDNSSRNIMKMNGSGITVIVTKEDGTTVTRTLSWGDNGENGTLTKTDDYSWVYNPPASDGKASYEIDYQTRVDMSGINTTVNVKNNTGDDHGDSGSNTGITPGKDDEIELKKSVNSFSATEVEWSVDLTVPKGGLDSAEVTDELPHDTMSLGYYDILKNVDVSGLLQGESYAVSVVWRVYTTEAVTDHYTDTPYPLGETPPDPTGGVNPPVQVAVKVKFFQDEGQNTEGLQESFASRVVRITIITENNPDWMALGQEESWVAQQGHTNTAKIGNISATANVKPKNKNITKNYEGTEKVTIDGGEYLAYKYYVQIDGTDDEVIEIFDTFDTSVFEVLTDHSILSANGIIYYDDDIYYQHYTSNTYATITKTNDGAVISTTELPKKPDDSYYGSYRIYYYLVLKDPELAQQKAFNAGGTVKFTNRVDWDGAKSEVDVEFGHPVIDKSCARVGDKATFTIVINPDKLELNNGNEMTLTDEFSNTLSIDYSSIRIVTDPAEAVAEVTYDYYGNTGVFKIPDKTKVTITYTSRILGTGQVRIWNKATLDSGHYDEYEDYVNVSSSGEGGANVFAIYLLKYASENMQAGTLAGAKFRVLDSELNPILYTDKVQDESSSGLVGQPITFVTNSDGMVMILLSRAEHGVTFKKNTVYYLEEIEAPPGMQLDPTLYSFVISDDPNHANYTREDGVYVYYVGDIMKIRNYPEELKLLLSKRFAGNVKLTNEQKNKISFIVERVDKDGNVITGEGEKFRKEIPYSDLDHDKYELTGDDGLVPGYYKVTETQDGLNLPGNVVAETTYSVTTEGTTTIGRSTIIDHAEVVTNQTTNVIFTNSYSTGAYYFTKLEAGTEQPLEGAVFSVFKADDETHAITTYTTGDDGKFMISRAGEAESILRVDTLYYVVETAAPEGYSVPSPAPKYYFYFGTEDAQAPEGATENAAVNLYNGSASQTVLNASDTSIMVKKEWFDGNSDELSESEKKELSATVALKRRVQELNAYTVTVTVTSKENGNYNKTDKYFVEPNTQFTLKASSWDSAEYDGNPYPNNNGVITIDVGNVKNNMDVLVVASAWTPAQFIATYTSPTSYKDAVEDSGFSKSAVLDYKNDWYHLWDDLEKTDASGATYSYYVNEVSIPDGFTVTYSNNDGIQSGTITVKNTKQEQKGALKLTKAVTVNGEGTTTTAADGDYTFTISGPGTSTTVNKTVTIKVENGVATQYKIDNTASFTNLPADKFVVISDLAPGDYTITETNSTNTNVTLASITGGKANGVDLDNNKVTVTVTAGVTIAAEATATFTNNRPTTEVEVNKTWLVGTTDYSSMLNEMFGNVTVEVGVVKVPENATDKQIEAAEIVKDVFGNDAKATMSAPTWSATIYNLPVLETGYKYAVKEISVKSGDNRVISSYLDTTLSSATTVNNAPKPTEVTVTKLWKPAIPENTTITLGLYRGKTVADATTEVTTIVLDGTSESAAENINGTDTKAGTKQETPGWTAEFKNLPKYAYDTDNGFYEIKYVVKEIQAPEGYTVSYSGTGAGTNYVITGGTITNTKNPGNLELTKKVAGDGADTSKEFEFTIELTAPAGETLAESYTFKKGDAEATGITYTRNGTATETASANSTATVTDIKLKADETFTIVGLPAGTTYKITETDYSAAGYSSTIPADGKTGIITGGTTAKEAVEVTNTLSAGSLTVEKTLEGNATNAGKEFNFKVTFEKAGLTGNNGTYKIGTSETITSADATNITFTAGKAEISYELKGGQKAVFSNLPKGTSFIVEETSKDADGYETTVSSQGGTVEADKTVTGSISSTAAVTVSFVNTKETIPVEATKAWKSGETTIAWPEDVESVEFTLYKTVNSQTTAVAADDLTNYWKDTSTFINPITVSSSTEGKKASWDNLPKRILVTKTETVDGQEVTTSAWDDVTYSVKETKINYTVASRKTAKTVDVAADENKIITNTETTLIHVTKEWQDKDGTVLTGNNFPENAQVTFTLLSNGAAVTKTVDGEAVPRTVILDGTDETNNGAVIPTSDDYEGADWTAYFTNLPVYDSNGKVITYTVEETVTWPGYVLVTTGEGITYPAVNEGKIINKESSLALDILKVDNAGTVITTGATFRLVQVNDKEQVDEVVPKNEQTGTTDSNGKLTFSNLKVGYYKITETVPPSGYILPSDATFYVKVTETEIKLLIKESGKKPSEWNDNQTSGGVVKTFAMKTETDNAKATVENTSGTALPQTGGIGTTLFTALGGLMTVTACAILTVRRWKRKTAES